MAKKKEVKEPLKIVFYKPVKKETDTEKKKKETHGKAADLIKKGKESNPFINEGRSPKPKPKK